jgi:hypothetical protein
MSNYHQKFNRKNIKSDILLNSDRIQSLIKYNYFTRLDKASIIHYLPQYETTNPGDNIKNIKRKRKLSPLGRKEKSKAFSDKIRKDNAEKIIHKKPKLKLTLSLNDLAVIKSNIELYKNELIKNNLNGKKFNLPKIEKKKPVDRYPIKIEKNYIENIENKYINPFVNNDNIIYTELIENKKSKIPLNFF